MKFFDQTTNQKPQFFMLNTKWTTANPHIHNNHQLRNNQPDNPTNNFIPSFSLRNIAAATLSRPTLNPIISLHFFQQAKTQTLYK